MYILAVSGVFGMVGWNRWWVTWGMLGVSPGVATCGGVCVKVATGIGMAESVSSGPGGSSVPSVEGGAPRATDGGSLLGILYWETGVEDAEEAWCSCSKAPWRCRLTAMVMSWGGSIVSAVGWVSTSVVVGTWMTVVTPSDCILLRSTSRICSSQKVPWEWPHTKGAAPEKWTVELLAHCLGLLCTLPCPHAAAVCIPAAGGPSHGHLHWVYHLLWHWHALNSTRVHGIWCCSAIQRLMASLCCHLPVAQVCRPPPLESGSRLGGDVPHCSEAKEPFAPNSKTQHYQKECHVLPGFLYTIPCPATDRAFSCVCMITCTWKLSTTREKSCDPHLAFAASSWELASKERATKSLIVVWNERRRIS